MIVFDSEELLTLAKSSTAEIPIVGCRTFKILCHTCR